MLPKTEGMGLWACFWVDAVKQEEQETETSYPTPEIACTVGFLLHADDMSISLVQELFSDVHRRNIVTVPREMIKSLTKIGVVRLPKTVRTYLQALRARE